MRQCATSLHTAVTETSQKLVKFASKVLPMLTSGCFQLTDDVYRTALQCAAVQVQQQRLTSVGFPIAADAGNAVRPTALQGT